MRYATQLFLSGLICLLLFTASTSNTDPVPGKAEDISPLLTGEKIPNVKLKSLDMQSVSLKDKVSEKPSILIFYRGGWCPFCNRQLSGVQGIMEEMSNMGYQILAISPDPVEKLSATVEKNNLGYDLLSDGSMEAAKKFGIAFRLPPETFERYKAKNLLSQDMLPVPAVFVLDQEGTIKFEYINPNYRERLNPKLLKLAAELALEK